MTLFQKSFPRETIFCYKLIVQLDKSHIFKIVCTKIRSNTYSSTSDEFICKISNYYIRLHDDEYNGL